MSDPRNKSDKSKKAKGAVLDDPKLARHERLTLFLYLEGAFVIIAGMVLLSEFLSTGKADRTTLYITGGLTGLFAVGFLTTYLLRRRGDA